MATDAKVVLRNIFLDGNTFRDSHSVDKKTLVGEVAVGAALAYKRWKLSFARVYRSKAFETQTQSQDFGSISLSYSKKISF